MPNYLFHVTPLTPLHPGSGVALEPFEYVIDGERLYRFGMDDFMLKLPPAAQAEFVERVEQSVLATRHFISHYAAVGQGVARWQAAVSGTAADLYSGRLAGSGHPEVLTVARTGDRPYLPGSSLKGALRTALLYMEMPEEWRGTNGADLEKKSFRFNKIQEDPFRAFKVSDGRPLSQPTVIRAVAVHTQRAGRWEEDLAMLVETIPGAVADNVEQTSLHTVSLDENFYRFHQDTLRLEPELILAGCRNLYGYHLRLEAHYLSGLPATRGIYEALLERAETLPDHACLVRLGWGSGRDATTVGYLLDNYSTPTSRRLADEGLPLGWAELSITDSDGQPLAVKMEVSAAPELDWLTPAEPEPEAEKAATYELHQVVQVKINGEWKRGKVPVEMPGGEPGFLKLSRRDFKSLAGDTVEAIVTKIRENSFEVALT